MLELILAGATILGGISALWFFVEKRKVFLSISNLKVFKREILILVDDIGLLDGEDAEFIKKLSKALSWSSKNKSYDINVVNSKFKSLLGGQSENGINKQIHSVVSEKFEDTEKALKLLINLRKNQYLDYFSDEEFYEMARGTLRYSCVLPYNPLLDRLDIWFIGNQAFRTTIEFSPIELHDLFEALNVNHLFGIMSGCVLKLPRDVICSKVIPGMVYSLEKYSEESVEWQTEQFFRIEHWNFGVA